MSTASTGSPLPRPAASRTASGSQENAPVIDDKVIARTEITSTFKKSATALTSSKLGNQVPKKVKTNHDMAEFDPMDKLLAKLSEQQAILQKQQNALKEDNGAYDRTLQYVSTASSSVPITPATDTFIGSTAPTTTSGSNDGDSTQGPSADEVLRLKLELEAAKGKIAQMDQELAQNRITKHTIDQVIGTASEADFALLNQPMEFGDNRVNNNQQGFGGSRPQLGRDNSWAAQDDARSDASDALSAGGFNRARAIWARDGKQPFNGMPALGAQGTAFPTEEPLPGPWVGRGYPQAFDEPLMPFPGPSLTGFRGSDRPMDPDMLMGPPGGRRSAAGRFNSRNGGAFHYAGSNSSYDGFTPSMTPYGSVSGMSNAGAMGVHMASGVPGSTYQNYQPSPIGTPLSPHAPEFTSAGGQLIWKADPIASEGQTYLPTTEPLNYRRLLDRTVNCNWKYIVDKIVCNNDQQASIFLQQKLKVGTTEQKYDIVEAIVAQAYPLMVNRFGNFLVQRCFEHGTPEQVIKIAEAIRGNTLNLSMDAFGCHVVQKAFDSVPEDYKAIMVHELLRRIPETVIHRYACHVWQKLFELRWTESPPQIMKYVNEALRGMWHEVALGETGSLVVQNIFENCLEEDKRPCIEEVLASIDIVAHGQFGNWCIQHICEHGAPADRSRAIDHVIRYASEYSMDQFASKVVEKCLKIGGPDFLGRYLDRVCEGRLDRPRIPLIDIASDQYGNYLIQYILTHSNPQHREVVASHIRKHMVSLRGSKFGSRVGMLCTNPAIATRPGPGVGPAAGAINPRMNGQPQNPRYGGAYR
ncbi:pumilio-family RNA binding repeat protein-like protein [Coleophoma cylindrospora]|uniref:Pumilio-family RNA binding repeat protein-like protein n=1 Tax=Coleophoma cylindrospora TaxID=1849047 RepID=A0A3D8SP41_9HELO|nr:pumilio-family RNA binding repeat protein-like protein [Coleophoma cylindrospora]